MLPNFPSHDGETYSSDKDKSLKKRHKGTNNFANYLILWVYFVVLRLRINREGFPPTMLKGSKSFTRTVRAPITLPSAICRLP